MMHQSLVPLFSALALASSCNKSTPPKSDPTPGDQSTEQVSAEPATRGPTPATTAAKRDQANDEFDKTPVDSEPSEEDDEYLDDQDTQADEGADDL